MIDPNILTGLLYVGSVFLFGTRGYWGLTLNLLCCRLGFHLKFKIVAEEQSSIR